MPSGLIHCTRRDKVRIGLRAWNRTCVRCGIFWLSPVALLALASVLRWALFQPLVIELHVGAASK